MRFLTVADRELRSAARRKWTHRTRWITAALFFVLFVWLLWSFRAMSNRWAATQVFKLYSILTFLYCLFIGAARTADCISAERREGTLGLLFLTNLNSAEILAGKLCSTALASVYGLMAIFPMLALPLLMGGITLAQFAQTVLGLVNGILFALAAGFLASVVCKRQFTAIALALGLTVGLAGGLMLGAVAATSYAPTRPFADSLAIFSPLYAVLAADGARLFGSNRFWHSTVAVAGISLGWLGLTTLLLARGWRDRANSGSFWLRPLFRRRSEQAPSAKRAVLRRRLLAINPMFWLAARQRVSAPVFMCLAVVLTVTTVYVSAPLFGRAISAGPASPVVGFLFAWLCTGLAIHALVLYYAAMAASQRLAEDKQTGALELILSTPTTERTISRGLWLAYWRKMLFPALLAVLVHVYFIWVFMVMATIDPPGPIPPGATTGEIFWSALLNQPLRGRSLDWIFGFMLRCALLSLLQLMITWPTLGWVGRWLGLRMKHPGFAPIASLALLCAPPVFLFSLACYLADKFNVDRLPDRLFLPAMMWLALAIGIGHCVMLSVWAATSLRHRLRPVAMSRYQPLPRWRWRLPSRRAVRRLAIAAAAFAAVVASLVAGYYGLQNRRGRQAWRAFQTSLKQSGESLDLSPLLPGPAPDGANFARSPAFAGLLGNINSETRDLLERMKPLDLQVGAYQPNSMLLDWCHQTPSPLEFHATWINQKHVTGSGAKRQEVAAAIVQGLQSQSVLLQELAAAARLPAFQISTNRDAGAVFNPVRGPILMLERAELLFQVRACAGLALGQNGEAAEDVLAGLRLARLARQLPDIRSSVRVQALLARSLQPLWEGLRQHAWTEPQLAALQRELAGFDLLGDYTNAVRRVVLAHIELWRAIPDGTKSHVGLPTLDGRYVREPVWELQPRAWWFENCIRLHYAGQNAIEQVDPAAGRIGSANNWSELNGLPLNPSSRELLQQSIWWGVNPASVAFVQTSLSQAIVACALERFRLANGVYPQTLAELVPGFLDGVPSDAVSGRPIIYQPAEDGSFILRGVGQNGTDDRKNITSDDWLWAYSTNAPSARK